MPKFSARSKANLATCHADLQRIFNEVIKHIDCTVLCGHRNEVDQQAAFLSGMSKVQWPDGKHNSTPSRAVDVMPYPVDWNDWKRLFYFAGFVQGVASQMGIRLRSGLDFNRDGNFSNDSFVDGPHYELDE